MNRLLLRNLRWMVMALCGVVLWYGCSDRDEVTPSDDALVVSCDVPDIAIYSRYYTLNIAVSNATEGTIRLSTTAGWLRLQADELPTDGYVDVFVTDNEEGEGRDAVITLTETATGRVGEVYLYQQGLNDVDENGSASAAADYCVGWGFNAFLEYQNPNSVCGRVIDLSKMSQYDAEDEFQSTQTVMRGIEEFSMESSYSLQQLASTLTKQMDKTTKILGVKKTTHRYEQVKKNQLQESCYGYGRLTKAVASRSIDKGVLLYLVKTHPNNLPFTASFQSTYDAILKSKNNATKCKALITKMIETYGTHIVINALAGGMIDYVVSFDKNYGSSVETKTEEYTKYVFGKKKKSSLSTETVASVNSTVSDSSSFSIVGGNKVKRERLLNCIKNMGDADALDETAFKEWLASIYYSPTNAANLGIIEFGIMPIWDLFNDTQVYSYIQEQVAVMNTQSNNSFSAKELGMDNYFVDLKKLDLSFDPNGTLVKIAYNDTLALEICSEYVPKIRTDRRVTVIYPIVNGVTRLNRGVFIGDGDGNPPAQVTMGSEDVFVTNMEGYGPNKVLDSLFILSGNIYASSYGAYCKPVTSPFTIEPQYYQLSGDSPKYPIVKIANLYWTRDDLHEEMDFGARDFSGRWMKFETLVNGTLYANAYQSNSTSFMKEYSGVWGLSLNEYGYRTDWYVPLDEDQQHLVQYFGRNLKALFPGQASGFEARFNGFYGYLEPETGEEGDSDDYDELLVGVGKYSCLAFKKTLSEAKNTGEVLVLTSDYAWFKADSVAANNNRYPVRAVRTSWRPYPSLQ